LRPRGQDITGDLVRLTDKEIVLKAEGKEVSTPVEQVLGLDLKQPGKAGATNYLAVELVDAACGGGGSPKKPPPSTLVSGGEMKVPLETVTHVYKDAQGQPPSPGGRSKRRRALNDVLGVETRRGPRGLNGTFGDADAEQDVKFDLDSAGNPRPETGSRRRHPLPSPRRAAETKCKLFDASGNLLMVAEVQAIPSGYRFTTPIGATVDYTTESLARLDYSKGKLAFLSDLEPLNVVEKFALERFGHYRKDKNLDGGPLRLKNQVYGKGLSIPATTELEYNLGGDYREFRAMVGVDDSVGGSEAATTLRVEGDGKELLAVAISRKEDHGRSR
jgi:hypothetical protein